MSETKDFKNTKHYVPELEHSYTTNISTITQQEIPTGRLTENEPKFVEKQWGSELIIYQDPHACKVMTLKPGMQVSNHMHFDKSETFVLIKGEMIVEVTNLKDGTIQKFHLQTPYSSITLETMMPHTFYCPDGQKEDTVFLEASTKDSPDDNYRFTCSGPRNSTDRGSSD